MDAAGSPRAVIVATFEAAAMAMVYAATYPERVAGLVVYCPTAKVSAHRTIRGGCLRRSGRARSSRSVRVGESATSRLATSGFAPSFADDPEMQDWWARVMRFGASPGAAVVIQRMVMSIDVRDVLPAIRVPTLVVYRDFTCGEAAYVSERIPDALLVDILARTRSFGRCRGSRTRSSSSPGASGRARAGDCARHHSVHGHRRLDSKSSRTGGQGMGGTSFSVIMRLFARSWIDSAAASWTPQETACSPRFDGRVRASRCATTIEDSRPTTSDSRDASRSAHRRERAIAETTRWDRGNIGACVAARAEADEILGHPAPSPTSSPGRGSRSTTAAGTSSKASPANGTSTLLRADAGLGRLND